MFRVRFNCHCEPLLGPIDLKDLLHGDWLEKVVAGGESGDNARVCDYDWVIGIRNACVQNNVSFTFKQTARFFMKEGRKYKDPSQTSVLIGQESSGKV